MKPTASRREVRKFGATFAVVALIIAGILFFRHNEHWKWFVGGSVAFLLASFFAYPVLRPLYIGWMYLAYALAWLNTRIVLGIIFYCVFTPVGLMGRLLGKDILNQRIDPNAHSYWLKRTPGRLEKKRYEQLF